MGKRVVVNLVRNGLGVIQQWTRSARRKVGAAAKCLQWENEDARLFLGNWRLSKCPKYFSSLVCVNRFYTLGNLFYRSEPYYRSEQRCSFRKSQVRGGFTFRALQNKANQQSTDIVKKCIDLSHCIDAVVASWEGWGWDKCFPVILLAFREVPEVSAASFLSELCYHLQVWNLPDDASRVLEIFG